VQVLSWQLLLFYATCRSSTCQRAAANIHRSAQPPLAIATYFVMHRMQLTHWCCGVRLCGSETKQTCGIRSTGQAAVPAAGLHAIIDWLGQQLKACDVVAAETDVS
jgi:hypothetical protein